MRTIYIYQQREEYNKERHFMFGVGNNLYGNVCSALYGWSWVQGGPCISDWNFHHRHIFKFEVSK
jgi:hypothetical protein